MSKLSSVLVQAWRLSCEAERAIDVGLDAIGYKRKFFSQKGQDRWVIEDVFHYMHGGYFVEVGSGDGRTHSNTYVLERDYGWTGVLIDAHSHYVEQGRPHRHCGHLCACVDAEERDVSFLPFGYMGGIVDGDTDYSQAKREALLATHKDEIIRLRSKTLGQLLESVEAPARIQYLSIDVEGAELRVLNGTPFDRYTFDAITIERPTPAVHKRLTAAGYVLARTNWCDGFYLSQQLATRLGIVVQAFEGMAAKFF
jgi:hypothetical protein